MVSGFTLSLSENTDFLEFYLVLIFQISHRTLMSCKLEAGCYGYFNPKIIRFLLSSHSRTLTFCEWVSCQRKIATSQSSSGKNNFSVPVSHIQHSAHSFSDILSSFLCRHKLTAPLACCDGTVTQKDTIVLHRIPFHSCLVIKKGLHG